VEIVLRESNGRLALRVTDNGRGFDPANPNRGAGLRNMRQRARHLGGTVEIVSHEGQGAQVTVDVRIT
jgi:signal transduction histidine kinase